ncbi:protein of unknown function DUF264 [Magnetococcus marinus MC-1]|uniref:Uncharacterized protein n=1 Tax=Magnetococcus marinus (strain ATCC BAA-1437 / JCM 17883 / MC-1) TaxID=156889 RepID=A0L8A6_MAGMM|nr:protein of unknown function DUF264 [Magnetococcus marinus MC-1]
MPELFFGGARGGGKTDFLLGDFLQETYLGGAWRGILFRRTYGELEEVQNRAQQLFAPLGAVYKASDRTWRFQGGSVLKLRYLERAADAARYQGHQYTWIGWDELTNWPDDVAYKMLMACLRSAHGIKHKRIRASGNPGGAGHQWVKRRFIDPAPAGYQLLQDELSRHPRIFIPSSVRDNAILTENDPDYVERLKDVGSKELVRAWLEGDWNIIMGAFFDRWSSKMVIKPRALPSHWTRFRAFDWGSARPFSVGWWAVSDGELEGLPKNALVRYREWYGSNGNPNVGLKMDAESVARGILAKEAKDETIHYSVADPAIFAKDGGPSIGERMAREGVRFKPADNRSRVGGWDQMRQRMVGEDGVPMLYCFDTCIDSIRTIPSLQHDESRPEDLDTSAEDHAADEWRYALMSRPYLRPKAAVKADGLLQLPTLDEMWAQQQRVTVHRI